MIQQETVLNVIDNSGAKKAKCIKVLGGFKKRYAQLGDIIVVSIQRLRKKSKKTSKVLKGESFLTDQLAKEFAACIKTQFSHGF